MMRLVKRHMRAAPRTTAPNPEADVYVLADGVVHPRVVGEASRLKRSVAPASLLAATEESRAFLLAFQDDPSRRQLALEVGRLVHFGLGLCDKLSPRIRKAM